MLAMTARRPEVVESDAIYQRVQASRLPIQVKLAQTSLSVRDFINLQIDDLLELDKRTGEPLEIIVGGKLKYFGAPGKLGRHRAIKVIRPITAQEEIIYEQ